MASQINNCLLGSLSEWTWHSLQMLQRHHWALKFYQAASWDHKSTWLRFRLKWKLKLKIELALQSNWVGRRHLIAWEFPLLERNKRVFVCWNLNQNFRRSEANERDQQALWISFWPSSQGTSSLKSSSTTSRNSGQIQAHRSLPSDRTRFAPILAISETDTNCYPSLSM